MRVFILALILFTASLSSAALAHSHITKTEPADGEVLGASPESIKITFGEPVRPKESFIHVLDKDGKQLNSDVLIPSLNEKALIAPLPELEFGEYTVDWKAVCLCADHGVTEGTFKFTLK